jgi:hypothetical protein
MLSAAVRRAIASFSAESKHLYPRPAASEQSDANCTALE